MVSWTVTTKVPLVVRPALSVAVAVTVVAPSRNVDPDAGEFVVESKLPAPSRAVVVNVTAAPVALVASALVSAGSVSVGALGEGGGGGVPPFAAISSI